MTKSRYLILVLAACGGAQTSSPSNTAAASGSVPIEWRATQKPDEKVEVSIVVAGEPTVLGTISAASDSAPGTPATCELGKSSATESRFACGATPAYNGYYAQIVGSELVVKLETSVDNGEATENAESVEVKRVPFHGTALTVAPYQVK